ncbi:MAG: phytanoyl-CoA dioxygenase family protein [Betaproteobacteria bacterium]|jgi:non-heme Fe2+,alpha-ketoglutarate-dependent halogenase|nr:phytanoyl-CoA dioxygenase family protein [Betaproteobacteria bacterium]MDH4293768.1 phytanoyl-CoA dioxygenase family protein [Betaproteobacteria bacterium]MDH5342436.1 phytanoyl-CoA dioxygenase family protein [Betaproteobacteria bacterium]
MTTLARTKTDTCTDSRQGPHALTPAQLAAYHNNGFLSPLPALGPDLARKVLTKIETHESQYGAFPSKGLKAHLYLPWMNEVVRHPAILDTVESIIGPDILCWSSRFFIKAPGDGGFVSWHQDVTYWGIDVFENILTAWIALSPATRENGVMKVIPGTHRSIVPHRESAASNMLLRGQEVSVDVDESKAVYMELKAGEMSLHHGLMFHGSEDNRSNERRVGFAVRYIPTRVKPLDGLPRDSAMLVRGTDQYGHFDLEPDPIGDMDPAAVEVHRKATATYAEINRAAVKKHEAMIAAQQ